MAHVVSVNVGLPRDLPWRGETVHTSIWKLPVAGRCWVRKLNVEGDGQGDLGGHGGENRAVMVYQIDSYNFWAQKLGRTDFTYGQFSENLTIEGLPDHEVCIGDRYRIGGALFEVSQPRVTCYRAGIRMAQDDMASLLVLHHRPGFYFRVLVEGEIGAGDEIVKVADGPQRMSVAAIDALLYLPGRRREELQRALDIPALSAGWKTSLDALLQREMTDLSRGGNPGLTGDTGPPPAWTGFRSLVVAGVERESASVMSFSFESEDGASLPAALPGQFVVLRVHIKGDETPLLRNYSISNMPGTGSYRISVKLETNGRVSSFLHQTVKVGEFLEVSAPRGTFTLRESNGPVVLIGAGIGATPLLAMLHALAARSSSREVWWLYAARSGREHPFARESRDALRSLARAHVHIVYSRPEIEDQVGRDYDTVGHLNVALLESLDVPENADFYLCGPPAFLHNLTAGLLQRGTASTQIHSEVFGPEASITPGIAPVSHGRPHAPTGPAGSGPRVSFVRSGLSVNWNAASRNLLELAEACDVPVRWSCRTGVCHTCEAGLIAGEVDYQPQPLEPAAEGNVLICCARPRGEVEVDL